MSNTKAPADSCTWAQDSDTCDWWTDCSQGFSFMDGGPAENSMKFCCYCGKPLKPAPWVDEPESDE